MRHTKYPSRDLPDTDAIIKWVDSGAADKYGIKWQSFNSSDGNKRGLEAVKLINAYYTYQDEGGSMKNKKALARGDIKQVFRGHRVTFDETGNGDGHILIVLS